MLLENAGVDRVLALDLHCGQIQGSDWESENNAKPVAKTALWSFGAGPRSENVKVEEIFLKSSRKREKRKQKMKEKEKSAQQTRAAVSTRAMTAKTSRVRS
jgi:hypothetical protein